MESQRFCFRLDEINTKDLQATVFKLTNMCVLLHKIYKWFITKSGMQKSKISMITMVDLQERWVFFSNTNFIKNFKQYPDFYEKKHVITLTMVDLSDFLIPMLKTRQKNKNVIFMMIMMDLFKRLTSEVSIVCLHYYSPIHFLTSTFTVSK